MANQAQNLQQRGPAPITSIMSEANEVMDLNRQWPNWYDRPDPVMAQYLPMRLEGMLSLMNAGSCAESALRLAISVSCQRQVALMTQARDALTLNAMRRRIERLPANLKMSGFPVYSAEVIWPQAPPVYVPPAWVSIPALLAYPFRVAKAALDGLMVNLLPMLRHIGRRRTQWRMAAWCFGYAAFRFRMNFLPFAGFIAATGAAIMKMRQLQYQPPAWNQVVIPPLPRGAPGRMVQVAQAQQPPEVIYHLVHGAPKPHKYAIIFVPSDPAHGLPNAHWTFGVPVEQARERVQNADPLVVFTSAPVLYDGLNRVYWRCKPDPVNEAEFLDMKSRGLACDCCWRIPCLHEMRFKRLNPGTKLLTLMSRYTIDGAGRCEIEESIDPRYAVSFGPKNQTVLVNPRGVSRVMRESHSMGSRLDVGYWLTMFEAMSPYTLLDEERVKYSLPNPLYMLVMKFKGFILPNRIEIYDVAPYRFRARFYPTRNRWFWFAMKGVSATMAALTAAYSTAKSLLLMSSALEQLTSLVPVPRVVEPKKTLGDVMRGAYSRFPKPRPVEPPKPPLTRLLEQTAEWMRRQASPLVKRFEGTVVDAVCRARRVLVDVCRFSVAKLKNVGITQREIDSVGQAFTDFTVKIEATAKVLRYNIPLKRRSMLWTFFYSLLVYVTYRITRTAARWAWENYKQSFVYVAKTHDLKPVFHGPAPAAFAELHNTGINLPCEDEFLSRLALMPQTTRANVTDLMRRLCNEHRWPSRVDRQGFLLFLERTVEEEGAMWILPDVPQGTCVNCLMRRKTYRGLCKECKRSMRLYKPERVLNGDMMCSYVGRRPLWSTDFKLPPFEFKESAMIKHRKCRISFKRGDEDAFVSWLTTQEKQLSCRGWNGGPMFNGYEPVCFPRGEATALAAFCVRLGGEPKYKSSQRFYRQLYKFVEPYIIPIEEETREKFLEHFSGDKLTKMLEAFGQIDEGWFPSVDENGLAIVKMKGFTKAEKGMMMVYQILCQYLDKDTLKPRFICCPDPQVLALLGPYTHAQTKWLAKEFRWDSHLYYAGCSTPEELNSWLQLTLDQCPEMFSYVDDISAMDSSHSSNSMEFHSRVRARQFRGIPDLIEALFEGEERLLVRVGNYKCCVASVNASGVSDTSYKNSLLCLFIRLFAVANAVRALDSFETTAERFAFIEQVKNQIWISASGDDGLTRMPRILFGTDMSSPQARERYLQVWAEAGFDVKLAFVPENRWRMATYLAMRPTWNGSSYVWTPEPARRLRSLYWMIDCSLHPTAWARGISTSLLACSSCNPILSPLARWHLDRTTGPTAKVNLFSNPYSVFHDYQCGGEVTQRSVEEFCVDYRVTRSDYERYLYMLDSTHTPLVDFRCFLLDRIFQEES